MAQHLLDDLHGLAGGQTGGGARVPGIVETDAGEPGLGHEPVVNFRGSAKRRLGFSTYAKALSSRP